MTVIDDTVLSYAVDNSVATITLNRPDALNALNVALKNSLHAAFEAARDDDSVRAVLLTATGRGFCAGQDLREHMDLIADGRAELSTVREHYNPLLTVMTDLPKPIVCAVNGMAAGAGAALTFACDFRLAADDSSFLMAFARVGLGADSGSSWTLQRLVGLGRATAMMMLAEPVSATHALEMGLVNAVVPAADLHAAAFELAAKLAVGPTFAYGAIKKALKAGASSDLASALELEADLQDACGATHDHVAAVTAFVAKAPVTFTGA